MGDSHVRRPGAARRYIVDRWDAARWREAGDVEAVGSAEAVRATATGAGTYRARPEGAAPETAQLYRVQLSGRPVPIDVL